MPASVDDIEGFCGVHLGHDEVERLVGWLAWRTGRNQALAGSGLPLARLRHALEHWVTPDQRTRLLGWMQGRLERGEPLVPR